MLEAVPRKIQNQNIILFAGMAELADALDSGSSLCKEVQVQVLLPAPNSRNPNHILVKSEWFGFAFYLSETI